MVLSLREPDEHELRARITVFGVGGAGGNAVNNMIEKRLEGVDFIAANTDAQALGHSQAPRTIQLGTGVTRGLGAGSKPDVGYSAAEESADEIANHLEGSHMCFITAGMGGGTGTGAAPVVARTAREMGILTVGVVTKPFAFEGARRMSLAEAGIEEMQKYVDTLIVIPNQNLFQVASERTTFVEAFQMADDVLYQGVQGVTDLMVRPGMINLDFADVRSVMEEMGKAMMGTGEAEGETRAIDAAEKAIANPLLDEVSLKGAKGVLINITGGYDLTLFEMDEAANRIKDEVDPNALIKFGSAIDPEMEGRMRVSVVATGIEADMQAERPQLDPKPRRRVAATDPGMMSALRGVQRRFEPLAKAAPEREVEVEAQVEVQVQKAPAAPAATARATTSAPARVVDSAPIRSSTRPQLTTRARSQLRTDATTAREAEDIAVEDGPEPASSLEERAATTPGPNDIRARAEEVRKRAIEARQRRDAELQPEPAEEPALFDLDDRSIEQAAAETELRHASAGSATRRAPTEERSAASRSGLFTINKLINRVAGGHAPAAAARSPERSLEAREDDDGDIPAFLRRQAN